MLFLQYAAGPASIAPAPLPLTSRSAEFLERVLLAGDHAARRRELEQVLASDPNLAAWSLRTAEIRLGRTINRIHEAADWLSDHLVAELAVALVDRPDEAPRDSIEWRLPALVKKLAECEPSQVDFNRRLEREKLEALKELAYGASHEINNPLANIAARAQSLLNGEEDPDRRQKLVAIHRQAMRAHEMISDLMLFARPPKLNPISIDLGQLVREVTDGLADLAAEFDVQLEFAEPNGAIEIVADGTQLGVAIHAVVKNAIEAVSDGGHVAVELRGEDGDVNPARDREHGAGRQAVIMVRDDGPGISEETRRHIFDPFFSGREAGRGLGFGLSKCWRIVTDHGGLVVVARPAGGGTEVSVLLPLAGPSAINQALVR
jgi:signal transduction histidine kinase